MRNNLEQLGGASLGGSASSMPTGNSLIQALQALQENPLPILRSVGLNVPADLSPQGIVDHLTRTGQVQATELNRVRNIARNMGISV